MANIKNIVKQGKSQVFRRLFLKRRDATTGLFVEDWFDITSDVKKWGAITSKIDPKRPSRFRFANAKFTVSNDEGQFNDKDDESSYWFDFAHRQRSLVKVEAGFIDQTLGADGIWVNTELPSVTTQFIGLISGDMGTSSKNTVNLDVKPISQIFRDFPADRFQKYTSTGITAQEFMEGLRDQTDGSGSFIFRPFLGDTTANWVITSTTVIYAGLNTTGADAVRDRNCWSVIEQLAEAENFVPYITRDGKFTFGPRDANTTTVSWEFYGVNANNSEYGQTIKSINKFGPKLTNYYSRVQVKFDEDDTSTSYSVREATLTVGGNNAAWNLGFRQFSFENTWIPNATVADSIAADIFNDYSTLRKEIDLTATFVPDVEVLDRISISYNSQDLGNEESLWDLNDWDTELTWDSTRGDAININAVEYKVLEVKQNLDTFETKIVARETV